MWRFVVAGRLGRMRKLRYLCFALRIAAGLVASTAPSTRSRTLLRLRISRGDCIPDRSFAFGYFLARKLQVAPQPIYSTEPIAAERAGCRSHCIPGRQRRRSSTFARAILALLRQRFGRLCSVLHPTLGLRYMLPDFGGRSYFSLFRCRFHFSSVAVSKVPVQ